MPESDDGTTSVRPASTHGKDDAGFAERLLATGRCPVEALMRLGNRAEADGKLGLAKIAYAAAMPYIHARPQSVELDAEAVVDLVRRTLKAKREGRKESELEKPETLGERLRRINKNETR